jgi:hypothetical protein
MFGGTCRRIPTHQVYAVLRASQAIAVRTEGNSPQIITLAALYLGFSAEHSACRIIEAIQNKNDKEASA